ncbi:MAG: IS256 family transposase [Fibrobacterota bacterium]
MRELDFSEGNQRWRWSGVKEFWAGLEEETRGLIKWRLEQLLQAEVGAHLGCARYGRSVQRRGYRNGSYGRDLLTRYGWIESLMMPRVRAGDFASRVVEKYRRRQRQVDQVVLEAFLLGHSTRKTRRLFRRVFGATISAQGVSNIVEALDEEVQRFHHRWLDGHYAFVYLDGLSITIRQPVPVKRMILVALGVRPDGSRELLDFLLAPSESEAAWWGFVSDLKERGLGSGNHPVVVMVTDGQAGLVKAVTGLYPRVAQQRCIVHKLRDLRGAVEQPEHQRPLMADARRIFQAATATEARYLLAAFVAKWSARESKAVRNFVKGVDLCLTYLNYPERLRTLLKTNNPVERVIEEFRRRLNPMRSMVNARSTERIVYGVIAYVLNPQPEMPTTEFTQLA